MPLSKANSLSTRHIPYPCIISSCTNTYTRKIATYCWVLGRVFNIVGRLQAQDWHVFLGCLCTGLYWNGGMGGRLSGGNCSKECVGEREFWHCGPGHCNQCCLKLVWAVVHLRPLTLGALFKALRALFKALRALNLRIRPFWFTGLSKNQACSLFPVWSLEEVMQLGQRSALELCFWLVGRSSFLE